MKTRKIIILGDSAFAEVAYEYFMVDSPYEVIGFSVEQAYLDREELFGLPVIPFESLEAYFPPGEYYFYAALVYTQLNRLRTRLYQEAKEKGYKAASYISSRASIWRNVEIAEHCFIFENNTIQPFVKLEDNVVLWSGNHVGHHSVIKSNCFIASQAVISGFCEIGKNCFVGVNATIANNVKIGEDCLIGAGALVVSDIDDDKVVKGHASEARGSARRLSKIVNRH